MKITVEVQEVWVPMNRLMVLVGYAWQQGFPETRAKVTNAIDAQEWKEGNPVERRIEVAQAAVGACLRSESEAEGP